MALLVPGDDFCVWVHRKLRAIRLCVMLFTLFFFLSVCVLCVYGFLHDSISVSRLLSELRASLLKNPKKVISYVSQCCHNSGSAILEQHDVLVRCNGAM